MDLFKTFIQSQGGDERVVEQPEDILPQPDYTLEVKARKSGVVSEIVADQIGIAAMMLGAGRETKESQIDLAAGLYLHKKVGDDVKEDEVLVTLYSSNEISKQVVEKVLSNILVSKESSKPTLVYDIVR